MSRLTKHGTKRMSERIGLSPKAALRMASIALREGITHGETKGNLKSYLDKCFLGGRKADNLRIYGQHVYLFAGDTLITVLHLPKHLSRAVAAIREKNNKP